MFTALTFFLWFLIGTATAYVAIQRQRDPYAWFAIGIFFGLFALIVLILLPAVPKNENRAIEIKPIPISPSTETSVALGDHDYFVKDWFYLNANHEQQGPIDFDALKRLWKEKKINNISFVWCEGMENWKSINDARDLVEVLEA